VLTIDQAMNPLLFASKHISVHPSSLKFFLLFTTQELRKKRERERMLKGLRLTIAVKQEYLLRVRFMKAEGPGQG
jgi:hypothetical protein